MSDRFCGLSVHASMITDAGVMNCRLIFGPAVVVTVAVAVGTVIASTSIPVVTVVVVITVLYFQSTDLRKGQAGACRRSAGNWYRTSRDTDGQVATAEGNRVVGILLE